MKICREQIIETALSLLDRDGLEGVTLRKVAADLHVHTGALYWHVRNKQDLIDEMANRLLSEQFSQHEEPASGQDWEDWLREVCQRLRQAMLAHREGARVVAGAGFARAITLKRLVEAIIHNLLVAGFPSRLAFITCNTILSYVYGFVIEEQAAPGDDDANRCEGSGGSILSTAWKEHQANNYTADMDFLAGLELILEGVKQHR
ncbi:TetR family transcriptional regulator [Thermosporothrix hazakensis]|jgi:TetR/AcrR family tetracycline transcriptional repressor|uniref:TetR family transcriptional regulator n=1 Tax=Thermosporothrix hazakensis TaxID=644383 RepID=A0A326U6G7_THEHA|nr:TetR/AcrR family transcriptional regulator C-terminal domain-containing protein [Thermosporothrix hazakensis]PZW26096.1 TetR family transcriptional regulator [Thermosporothrix hazakensis]GCE51356.1 TetR family transcriptional regulator [Thermosporothrix hazakensis]